MIPPIDMVTDDGYDLQFGTNVLGHFYFTKLVLPTLLSTAKTSSDGTARVVNTASNGHWFGNLKYDTMKDGPQRKKETPWKLYGQSKTVSRVVCVARFHPIDGIARATSCSLRS